MLLGIRDGGGGLGSNKDEILTAYEHFTSTVVKPIQKFLLKEFDYLLRTCKNSDLTLSIEPRTIFDTGLLPQGESSTGTTPEVLETNEALRSLSGRQFQGLMRIVRQYNQEKITLEQAKTMLSSGFGLNEEQINNFLGLNELEQ